ncbi:hypothetical protein ACQPZ2_01985 [Nocardia pseudovaccinii]|uniref:hypothetical protein n=1 Tax=Nocardia pseudovaccinii TaxID=189540 RepID=UPI003D949476
MLRVYLDQAKWIDLSKCRVGHHQGTKFQDVYDLASEAVSRGYASFVLSCAHYYETQSREKSTSRLDLAWTMALLSKFHCIAPVQVVVPAEIEHFLTGEAVTAQVNLFGVGMNHAFNTNVDLGHLDPSILGAFPPGWRAAVAEAREWVAELFVLGSPPTPTHSDRLMLETARTIRDGAQKFVDAQTTLSDHLRTQNLRHRLNDYAITSEIADFIDPLMERCQRHGISMDEVFRDKETIRELLQRIPSRWVSSELRRVRLRNPQQPWTKNDLNDILALSIAVPYCDVVVTERQWSRHINHLGLAEQYGTTVLHDLTELTEVLVTASTTAS